MKNKNLDILDLVKVILSIIVVGIHINPFGEYSGLYYPICRIAVPLFFMISSYLLFSKLKNNSNSKEVLVKFVKRNLKLYLFWLVLLFPIAYVYWEYYKYSFWDGILRFIKNFFFGSTFLASWYIMALIEGILIIYFLSKKFSNTLLLILSTFIYFICCLASNYYFILNYFPNKFISKLVDICAFGDLKIYNSFFAGLVWIVIGKMIAIYKVNFNQKKSNIYILLISLVLLYAEHYIIQKYKLAAANDCYIMLLFLCPMIFLKILSINISINNAKLFRKFSTITYCTHFSIATVLDKTLYGIDFQFKSLLIYSVVLLSCLLITFYINRIEDKKFMKILKYSY